MPQRKYYGNTAHPAVAAKLHGKLYCRVLVIIAELSLEIPDI
jgi:hypothetical protein